MRVHAVMLVLAVCGCGKREIAQLADRDRPAHVQAMLSACERDRARCEGGYVFWKNGDVTEITSDDADAEIAPVGYSIAIDSVLALREGGAENIFDILLMGDPDWNSAAVLYRQRGFGPAEVDPRTIT